MGGGELGDLGLSGRIILKLILKKVGNAHVDCTHLFRDRAVTDCYEPASMKDMELFKRMSDC